MTRFDGYIRVSRVGGREGPSFISPDVQREQIERWAALREVEIAEWHVDLDQSGAKIDRPAFSAALERVEARLTGGIVVAKIDRFARSLSGALEAIHRLDEAGAEFASVQDGIDPSTPAGKMLHRLLLVLAEFELDRVRENWRIARDRAVARGVHISAIVPAGYERGADGRLEPDRFAPAVRRAFELRAGGATWTAIAHHLNESGVPNRRGGAQWTATTIQHMMGSRTYLGEARHGEFVNEQAHEPLVDRFTFEAAQSTKSLPAVRSARPALLAGLLRCAGCSYLMRPDSTRQRDGERQRMYRCRGEHGAGTCGERSAALAKTIEPFVETRFFATAGEMVATGGSPLNRRAELRRAVDVAEAELAAYRDDERIIAALGPDRFVEGLRVRAESVEQAYRAAGTAEARVPGDVPRTVELQKIWPDLAVPEKRKLLAAAFDSVFLRRSPKRAYSPIEERVVFFGTGEGPADLPGLRNRVRPRPLDAPAASREALG